MLAQTVEVWHDLFMEATNYGIEDGHGNTLTVGLQGEEHAERIAQRMANERGESVWMYEDGDEPGESVEFRPSANTRQQILDEMRPQDAPVVATYTDTYLNLDADQREYDAETTVRVRVHGRDDIGYVLTTDDDADGPGDEAGTDVYQSLGTAIVAAVRFAESQEGGQGQELIGMDAEAYEAEMGRLSR
jgi:two-component sensor histidine kinase